MKNFLTLILITVSINAAGQLREGQWLIGGNGLLSYSKTNVSKFVSIQFSPAAGYFLKDRFALGLRPGFFSDTRKSIYDYKYRFSTISISTFARYYFLQTDQKVNLFVDASFGYSWVKSRNFYPANHRYNFYQVGVMAGPAIFLNERTALEITVAYNYISRGPIDTIVTHKIMFGIGLQVHLGKPRAEKK